MSSIRVIQKDRQISKNLLSDVLLCVVEGMRPINVRETATENSNQLRESAKNET